MIMVVMLVEKAELAAYQLIRLAQNMSTNKMKGEQKIHYSFLGNV